MCGFVDASPPSASSCTFALPASSRRKLRTCSAKHDSQEIVAAYVAFPPRWEPIKARWVSSLMVVMLLVVVYGLRGGLGWLAYIHNGGG